MELSGNNASEKDGAAFYVERDGNPRISSVEFENFCIDGLHFEDDGTQKMIRRIHILMGRQEFT